MRVTKKLAIAFSPISLVAFLVCLFTTDVPSNLRFLAFIYALSASGASLAIALLVGRSIDRNLGAEPQELRRMASELSEGYLPPLKEDETRRQGAAGKLDVAIAQLNTVFRATKGITSAVIERSHRILSLSLAESGDEKELRSQAKEIAALAGELASDAMAFQEAIGFYSFDPLAKQEDKELLLSLKNRGEHKQNPSTAVPRHKPSHGHKPKLRLLPRMSILPPLELEAAPPRLIASAREINGLRLIDPIEESKE